MRLSCPAFPECHSLHFKDDIFAQEGCILFFSYYKFCLWSLLQGKLEEKTMLRERPGNEEGSVGLLSERFLGFISA